MKFWRWLFKPKVLLCEYIKLEDQTNELIKENITQALKIKRLEEELYTSEEIKKVLVKEESELLNNLASAQVIICELQEKFEELVKSSEVK